MMEDLEIQNYSPNTVRLYVFHVAQFAKHFGKSPDFLGPAEIREYQLFLLKEKKLSPSTLKQVVAALRFFYGTTLGRDQGMERLRLRYGKREKRLPTVLNKKEVLRLFSSTPNLKHRTIMMTLYSTGVRVSEVIRLRVDDIDSQRMLIRVDQGKGRKDRYVPLLPSLLTVLRTYWQKYRPRDALFLSQRTRAALTTGAVFKICSAAQKKATLPNG